MASFKSFSVLIVLGSVIIAVHSGISGQHGASAFMSSATAARKSQNPVLYSEDFEGKNPFSRVYGLETGPDHALSFVDSPVFQGKRAVRFELRKSDPLVKNGKRAEAVIVPAAEQKDRWYAFAVYFPREDYPTDSQQEIISQWRQRPDYHLGEEAGSPPTALRIKKDRFLLDVGFTAKKIASEVDNNTRRKMDMGPVTKDTWHQFVFHFIHSYQQDGLIEVWHNGKKVLTHQGGNIYNNVAYPKWKIGLYKASFKNGKSEVDKRVIYFDNIRVGNEFASFERMSPANANDPDKGTP